MPAYQRVGASSPNASYRAASSQRNRNSPPVDETIGLMLTDLVSLSHNIERYLAENPTAVKGSPNARVLKAEEIERVVRRVEVHFKSRVDELDRIVQEQKDVILQLSKEREMWKRRAEAAGEPRRQSGHDLSNTPATSTALSDCVGDATPRDATARPHDVQQLRQTLAEEKRQRLLVEEQTQHLTEQHAKVVNTLEQRIRKQEKQLQSMVEVFEQHGGGSNGAGGVGIMSSGGGSGTPRSLKFRQRQLRFDDHPPTPDRTVPASSSSAASQHAMPARALSADIAEVIDVSSYQPSGKNSPSNPPPSTMLPLEADADMDDVAAFLANISKELESISSVESQRHTKIASLT